MDSGFWILDCWRKPFLLLLVGGIFAALCGVVSFADDASKKPSRLGALVQLLADVDDPAIHRDVLKGMLVALRGRRSIEMPATWPQARSRLMDSPDVQVRDRARELAVLFGDAEALKELQAILGDPRQSPERRTISLAALLQRRPAGLEKQLVGLLDDDAVRGPAVRALAEFNLDPTPGLILERYSAWTAAEKEDAVYTLAARLPWARELVKAMASGRVPRADVSAFTVRQLLAFNDSGLTKELTAVWGVLRPASEERTELISKFKQFLKPEFVAMADVENGHKLFARTCASCHVLFGEGGKIGPELTGSQRQNLDYVLENLVDPSAVVGRDFQVTIVSTLSGRTIHGIVRQETPGALVLQTPNETVTVPKNEVDERKSSAVSLMPEGLLAKLTEAEVRDLVAYLGKP